MHIYWFTHSHENRNDYLKYSLMKLHLRGDIHLSFQSFSEAKNYGFSDEIIQHEHRHTSLLLSNDGNTQKKIVVDSEDSFAMMRDPIKSVDIYFCAGFNSHLHIKKEFIRPFKWQTEEDIKHYKTKLNKIIENYENHFYKIRKFIPIGPNMGVANWGKKSWTAQKIANAKNRIHKLAKGEKSWEETFLMFEARYQQILSLRKRKLQNDVVLYDTLWGWPRHRVKLHENLRGLSNKYDIYSKLKWHPPYEIDNSINESFNENEFPIQSVKTFSGNYEEMLASSRLAVFATGFHWGWRNIMTFAFMIGLPIYMDRLLLEPYFNMKDFEWFENTDQWESIEDNLLSIDEKRWSVIKLHNQSVYDKYMHPIAVGDYFINEIIK